MPDFNSNCVIISGSTGGIGEAVSKVCISSKEIQRIILLYKDKKKLDLRFANEESSRIKKIYYHMENDFEKNIFANQSILNQVKEVKMILTAFAIEPIRRIEELDMSEIIKNININILAQLNLINTIVKTTKENGQKLYIININTGAAYNPLKGWSLYSAAKAYINMYLRTLKLENEVEVVSFDPGVVDTSMQKYIRETNVNDDIQTKRFVDYYQEKYLNTPEEVALEIFDKYILDWAAIKFEERFV